MFVGGQTSSPLTNVLQRSSFGAPTPFRVSFRHSSFSRGPIDLTYSRRPLASAWPSLYHCTLADDVTRAIPARSALCSSVSAILPLPVCQTIAINSRKSNDEWRAATLRLATLARRYFEIPRFTPTAIHANFWATLPYTILKLDAVFIVIEIFSQEVNCMFGILLLESYQFLLFGVLGNIRKMDGMQGRLVQNKKLYDRTIKATESENLRIPKIGSTEPHDLRLRKL